jgi:hypothetical protein
MWSALCRVGELMRAETAKIHMPKVHIHDIVCDCSDVDRFLRR